MERASYGQFPSTLHRLTASEASRYLDDAERPGSFYAIGPSFPSLTVCTLSALRVRTSPRWEAGRMVLREPGAHLTGAAWNWLAGF